MRMERAGAEPISGQAHRCLLGAGPRASTPQPSVDPRLLPRAAHNTASQVEGSPEVERGAGSDGHGRLFRRPDSDNSGLQNLTCHKPLRVHLDKLPDGSPSGTTHPSAERFLCCVFDEFVPLGCKAPFPDKTRLPRRNAYDGPYLGRATSVSSSSRTERVSGMPLDLALALTASRKAAGGRMFSEAASARSRSAWA